MKVDTLHIIRMCRDRGPFPYACKKCPANPDSPESRMNFDGTLSRCVLGYPRAWDTTRIYDALIAMSLEQQKERENIDEC